MHNHLRRILTALVVAPTFLCLSLFAPTNILTLLFFFIMTVALQEYKNIHRYDTSSLDLLDLLVLQFLTSITGDEVTLLIMPFVALLYTLSISMIRIGKNAKIDFAADKVFWASFSVQFFGYMWLIWPAGHLIVLLYSTEIVKPMGFIIYFVCTSWVSDIAALYIGQLAGKTKPQFLHKISPNKTLEGIIAALIFGTLTFITMASVLGPWIRPNDFYRLTFEQSLFVGLAISGLCVLGDLLESLFKRTYNIKDSGCLFPGHGGALDRLDSLLLPAPFVLYCATILT